MPNKSQESSNKEIHSSFLKSLPKPQRTAFLFLSVLSLGIFVLWIWQFNANITGPFKTNDKKAVADTGLAEFETALANFDTDGDGLTDNEELNLYNTSKYLEDTDSDGINDREEIEQGSDPNCAAGTSCETEPVLAATAVSTSSTNIAPAIATGTLNVSADSADEKTLQAMMSGLVDASTLRSLLIDSGVKAEMLQNLNDEELMAAYQNMLESQKTTDQ